jgi:hypothetical protein
VRPFSRVVRITPSGVEGISILAVATACALEIMAVVKSEATNQNGHNSEELPETWN